VGPLQSATATSLYAEAGQYYCRLAEARLRAGKVDEAVNAGQQALDVTDGLNSARSTAHIRSVCREMRPHTGVPEVREFLERARGLVA
jgi:hypothetical protein